MELKRILAKDARSASEKATALYGSEVMVISCNKVGAQTELIVAIDAAPQPAQTPPEAPPAKLPTPITTDAHGHPFAEVFELARQHDTPVEEPAGAAPVAVTNAAPVMASDEAKERLRGQELVTMVREEIASLRREFQLSRLGNELSGPQGTGHPLRPVIDALSECQAPAALRTLLMDELFDCSNTAHALQLIHARLEAIAQTLSSPSPCSGIHALCGPSGAGKTLMAHRLIAAAQRETAIEDMVLISCADHKPGAWSQTQILAAQTGIDAYRARDLHALKLLIEELGGRKLLIIDTAGSDPIRQVTELSQLGLGVALHCVVPADASFESLRRLHSVADLKWQSLMLSKLDEQPNPWPLLGFLASHPTPISAISRSEKAQDGLASDGLDQLLRWAVDKLQNTLEAGTTHGMQMPAMQATVSVSSPIRVAAAAVPRAKRSRSVKAPSASPIQCLQ